MKTIDLGQCLSRTIDIYKSDVLNHVLATFVIVFISGMTAGVLNGTLLAGYYRCMEKSEKGEAFKLGDIFCSFNDQLVPSLLAGLLPAVIIAVGFMFCVIPGILVMPLLPFAVYAVALGGETDGVNAVKTGFQTLGGNLLMGVVTMFILSLLGSLGAVVCGIGILLTLPLNLIGTYVMAAQVGGNDDPSEPEAVGAQ